MSSILYNSLALIKKGSQIEADKPLSAQIHSVTLTEDSPYETLHSIVSKVVAPFFKSYVRESGKLERLVITFSKENCSKLSLGDICQKCTNGHFCQG